MTNQVLLVEDDKDLREVVQEFLTEAGLLVRTAADGAEALQLVDTYEPELVLLDLNLPRIKGEMVCKKIKADHPQIQVIMVTAKDTTSNVIEGLSIGADDYVTKPPDFDELFARIKARLRNNSSQDNTLSIADLKYNTDTLEVHRSGQLINLTPQELKILEYLLINKGRVLSREMILSRLWKGNVDIETRVIDVYIGYLRKKIDQPFEKKLIKSIRGFGYKIAE